MADTRVGGAYIDFSARTGRLLAGVRQAGRALGSQERAIRSLRRTIQSYNREARQMVSQAFSLRGAIGLVAGTAGLGYLIRQSINSAAEVKNLAIQAGVTGEAFQELTFVARNFAVTQDGLVDGLKELNLRVDEFVATGKGPAQEALERLGFTTQELAVGLTDAGSLFDEVIRRMQGLETAAQVRVADELFGGTAGEQFVRIVEGGTAEVMRLRRAAHETGQVFDDAMLERADQLRIEFANIEALLRANFQRAIIENADAIQSLARGIADLAPQIVSLSQALAQGFGYLVQNAPTILSIIAGLRGAALGAGAGGLIGSVIPGAGTAVGALIGGGLGSAVGGIAGTFGPDALRAGQSASDLRERIDRLTASLEALGSRGGHSVAATRRRLQREIDEARDALAVFATVPGGPAASPAASLSGQIDRARESTVLWHRDAFSLMGIFRQFAAAEPLRPVELSAERIRGDFEVSLERLEELPPAARQFSETLRDAEAAAYAIGRGIGDFAVDFADNIRNLGDAVRRFGQQVVDALKRIIAQRIALQVAGALTGSSSFVGLFGPITGAESGGLRRGLTLVGERGPELVDFRQAANVIPADRTRDLLGGPSVNLSINVSGSDAAFVEAVVTERVVPQLVPVIEAGVAEAMRRGR